MSDIKLCPVCGRRPKIIQTRDVSGCWCTIQCRRLLFNRHQVKIEAGKASPEPAYKEAVRGWNEAVEQIEAARKDISDMISQFDR